MDMKLRDGWIRDDSDLAPLADHTGPFPHRDFLECWWNHRASDGDRLTVVDTATAVIPTVERSGRIELAGEEDLVDYHSPLGSGVPDALGAYMSELESRMPFRFDSLPAEAAEPVMKGLQLAGISAEPRQHAVTAVLELPAQMDDWFAAIGKKERHEVRRKRRRFEADLGTPVLRRLEGREAVTSFAAMHRRASGEKGEFMDPTMEDFFASLEAEAGGVLDFLYGHAPDPVAAAFGFEDEDVYYLYNSAYEPSAGHASPGIVLLAELIDAAIRSGRERFDFLKGDETYKFRHGAEPRPLFVLEGMTP